MKTEELQNKSYEELVQLQQEGKITLVEFVEAQSELTDEWKEWIDTRPISDESARAFLAWHEEYAMNHQNSNQTIPLLRVGGLLYLHRQG